ncbi:hypothetical protein C4D60_Mb07t15420 [Musa balbisiana]|uniref:Uncharacterized protein n=1 Tax=Musa balbisiana TaxID=52838 RepID=A0A4S8JGP2_MUSBA|nr:hypothetical protein C4D60_Mb07t15420 [Musa balbisiana]
MPLPPCRPPPRRSASLSPRRRPSIPEWNPVISGDGREEEEVRPVVLNDREYADGIGRIEDQGIRGGVPAKFLYRESAPAYRRVKEKSVKSPRFCNYRKPLFVAVPSHIFKFWTFLEIMF